LDPEKPTTTVRVALDPGCGNQNGGESLELRLNAHHTVRQLYDAVNAATNSSQSFDLLGGFPPAVLESEDPEGGQSLQASRLLNVKVMQRKKLPTW